MKRLGLVGGLFLFSACAPEITQEQSAIINGEVAADDQFAAVGALAFDTGGPLQQYCTGTLIAPNIVMSAAHCVDPALSNIDLETTAAFTKVVFGDANINDNLIKGVSASVEQIFMNEDFNINDLGAGNDVSILVLTESVVGIEPIPVSFDNAPAFVGDRFTAVGFGVNNPNQTGSGIKRFTTMTLEDVQGELTFYGFGDFDPADANTNVCSGDSGGPDLIDINGKLHVFGIHSFVFDINTCLGGAGAQRTDTQSAFIDPILAEFADIPEPPAVPNEGRCSVQPAGNSSSTSTVFLLFVAAAFALRRRKTS